MLREPPAGIIGAKSVFEIIPSSKVIVALRKVKSLELSISAMASVCDCMLTILEALHVIRTQTQPGEQGLQKVSRTIDICCLVTMVMHEFDNKGRQNENYFLIKDAMKLFSSESERIEHGRPSDKLLALAKAGSKFVAAVSQIYALFPEEE